MPVFYNKLDLLENLLVLAAEVDKKEVRSEQAVLLEVEQPNSSTGAETIRIIL